MSDHPRSVGRLARPRTARRGREGAHLHGIIAPEMDVERYLAKAEQFLAGAQLAVDHGQYNNAANRAYYAAFQAAIAALRTAGVEPPTPRYWGHDFVLREYCARLARPHGNYPPESAPIFKALQD